MATSASRGIWINALCFMWEAKDRGKLTGTIEELAKLLGSTNGDFEQFLEDCKRHRFGDVTVRSKFVTLINRRMYKEQKEREITRLRVREFRSKKRCNADVTPPSSSSSSNIINNKRFYYKDPQQNYICKSCQRIFSKYENFKSHECEEKK